VSGAGGGRTAGSLVPGKPLVYGQSITNACIDWSETHGLLTELAAAVRSARGVPGTREFLDG
jgi:phospho-2-dehydro-3-deoxyheptonate aldolase